jgi:hypothetical protein
MKLLFDTATKVMRAWFWNHRTENPLIFSANQANHPVFLLEMSFTKFTKRRAFRPASSHQSLDRYFFAHAFQ